MDPYAMLEEMFESEAALVGFLGTFLVIMLVLLVVLWAYAIAAYVLHSLGLYKIAKRRGIHNPWLAWLPIGQSWILGNISDHFQHVTKAKQRKFRIVLAVMEAVMYVWMVLYFVVVMGSAFSMAFVAEGGANAGAVFGFMGTAFLMVFLLMAIAVTYSVFAYLAYYDLFKSCKPDNAVLFLVLSIFVNVTLPFFIFACRNSDEGLPPKIRNTVNS